MADASARLLGLLSLLQAPREWSGSELAARMGVSPRTIRRDVERLRDLGYPVQATMGPDGGYRLVAGAAMPPLLLDDEEAVAIAIGLRTAAGNAVEGIEEASVRALAKLEQVLPSRLRRRVATLNAATVPLQAGAGPSVDPNVLAVVASASAGGERLRFAYSAADGSGSRRLVEPYRLVAAGRRWYLVAYDTGRDDWRSFRVDRMTEPFATGERFAPRVPPEEDAAAFVTRRLYSQAPVYRPVVTIRLPIERVRGWLSEGPGDLEAIDENTCRLSGHADTLEWLAARLLMLGCEFEVHEPPELLDHLRELAGRAARACSVRAGGPVDDGRAADAGR
ncbi:YafY family transcriptional regulator [Microtetraspora sp. AC03309]|uniref:helix-turn-helix transcriptional regulator n=1 Tax=Microtetraspora sp. AC03309 TaxID=2779376 RepID=UPI001E351249|nr:YafY family protein [Microtetraspora sp. AC03309]MCC5581122.1 YafY family transcriptional regulator [Microtetraspora sp. AC03309]